MFLTGRGPLRATVRAARAARRNFKAIAVKTVWLEPADYPTFVGMADLGLCLHQSSSGLDLPMKLADLRGAGVPVAAYDYAPVLGEVMDDRTGRRHVPRSWRPREPARQRRHAIDRAGCAAGEVARVARSRIRRNAGTRSGNATARPVLLP